MSCSKSNSPLQITLEIGNKAQEIALEFIYHTWGSASYGWIYWISAITQESLMDGYEKIVKLAKIPVAPGSKPIDAGERVLWLKLTPHWLLGLPNLDHIKLSTHNIGKRTILSVEPGPIQHTSIITQNLLSGEHCVMVEVESRDRMDRLTWAEAGVILTLYIWLGPFCYSL